MLGSVLLLAAAVALLVGLAVAQDQCGNWAQECVPMSATPLLPDLAYVSSEFELLGLSSGDYTFNRTIYSDATCGRPELVFTHSGRWAGLGPSATVANGTNLMLVPLALSLTPLSENAVNYLNQYCACNGSWARDTERFWSGCPDNPENCRINFLGVGPASSLIPFVPLYGNALASGSALSLSRLDGSLQIGFSSLLENNPYPGTPCRPQPVLSQQFCGMWTLPCVPNLPDYDPNSLFSSLTDTFSFTSMDNLALAGAFRRTRRYFSDFCSTPSVTVEEIATARPLQQTADLTTVVEKRVFAATVTPHSADAAATLNRLCPCAEEPLWQEDQPRTLTTCPDVNGQSSCPTATWFQDGNTTFGAPMYAAWLERVSFTRKEVLMGPYGASDQPLPLLAARPGYAVVLGCSYPSEESLDYCGNWSLTCGAAEPQPDGVWGKAAFDSSVDVGLTSTSSSVLAGAGAGGVFTQTVRHYLPGQHCGVAVTRLEMVARGYWSDVGPRTVGQAAQITTTSLTITPYSTDVADMLNDPFLGCPCEGIWAAPATRVLTSCPPGSCPAAEQLGAGLVGSAGWASIVRVASFVRLSSFSASNASIASLGLAEAPLDNTGLCTQPDVSSEYCGNWSQHCAFDALSGLDMSASFLYLTSAAYDNQYAVTRQWFTGGRGCSGQAALTAVHVGTLALDGPATSVPYANIVASRVHSFTVTASSAAGAAFMAARCPCGVMWNSSTSLDGTQPCPAGTCPDGGFLRHPFGKQSYAVAQRLSTQFRLSAFALGRAAAASTVLATSDVAFDLGEAGLDYCAAPPPGSSSGDGSSLSGGAVFLIVVFALGGAYFVGGIAFNYFREGQVRLPQSEFWLALPGLIADGVRFSTGREVSGGGYAAVP